MEVMRISLKRDGDEWNTPKQGVEIASSALRKHFDYPEEVSVVDVVIHTRPSRDRLDAEGESDQDGLFLSIEAVSCHTGTWQWHGFPYPAGTALDKRFARMLKRYRFAIGRKLYVGIEY